jgi:actin-like ATPase involved in cell morphogenesis
MGYYLGIDLGTTYTAAAAERVGVVEAVTLGNRTVSVPSVVFLRDDGEILVGEPATRRAMTDPSRVAREFKRRVGDPTPIILGGSPYSAELLMARLLRWSVDRVHEQHGEPPHAIALTHPANWGHYKTDLFTQAVRQVDLDAALLLPEPVAAATFYASQRRLAPGSVVAVYDLGGGTFDAALVRRDTHGFEIIGTPEGIDRLGGIDFDEAVFSHVRNALGNNLDRLDPDDPATRAAVARLRQDCIDAKEALSSDTDVSIPVLLPNLQTEIRLNRSEFETMITPAITETIVALRRAIRSAQMSAHDIDAVLLVGGSSRIPLVAQMVATALDRPIAIDANPKDAIAFGAAITLAQHHGTATPETITTHIPNPHPTTPTHPQPNRPRQHQPTQSAPPRQRRSSATTTSPTTPSRQRSTTKPNSSPRQQPRTNRRRTPDPRAHSPISMILGGALATLLLTTTAISTRQAIQASHDTQGIHHQIDLATASIGPGGIITTLQNERNYGSFYILGYDGALQLPMASLDEATSETDDAIASFRDEIASKGGTVERSFAPALAAIDEQIDGLREIPLSLDPDDPDARTPTNTDISDPYFTGFTELINTLFTANGQVALSIDDPTLRRGVELTDLATHQIENVALLTRVMLLAGVNDQLNDPGEIAEAAGLLGRVNDTYDDIADLGTGRYRDAARAALDTFDASGYVGLVEQAINEDTVPLGEMMSSLSREDDEGFNGFRTEVNNEITARIEELEANTTADKGLNAKVAIGTSLAAVLTLVAMAAVIIRQRRHDRREGAQDDELSSRRAASVKQAV